MQTRYQDLIKEDLTVLKYDGPNEDGIFNSTGGTLTTIPYTAITHGTAFGANYLQFDVEGFGEFWIMSEPSVLLPLQLVSFDAKRNGSKADIFWTTANEVNVNRFEVERSSNGVDFAKINSTTAKNISSASYLVYDNDLMRQTSPHVFYRLKQIDNDGRFALSQVVKINLEIKGSIRVSPNPARDIVRIEGSSRFNEIQVYDVTGRLIKRMSTNSAESYNIENLNSGMYSLKLVSKTETVTHKLVVQ